MPAEPLRYYDRYAQALKTERIYGEKWMRRAYGNPVGRLAVWLVVRRAWFSRWYGWKMKKPISALRVLPFIAKYDVDVDEFAKSPFDYKSFNDFFCRALKPQARPIAAGEDLAVFPADGRHLAFPDVDVAEGFYVKGSKFSLAELLGERIGQAVGLAPGHPSSLRSDATSRPVLQSSSLGSLFAGGAMLISRLCPVDYHRFHFPVAGVPGEPRLIRGWLYSVSPLALRRNLRYLVENKRQVTLVESPLFGTVAIIEVGATNVGSILQTFVPGRAVAKGEEKGFFAFGGSCVITLFQRGRIVFDPDIVEQSAHCVETFAKMGDRLGGALP